MGGVGYLRQLTHLDKAKQLWVFVGKPASIWGVSLFWQPSFTAEIHTHGSPPTLTAVAAGGLHRRAQYLPGTNL